MDLRIALYSPGVTCNTDSQGPILKTEAFEAKSLYGEDVTDTGAWYTCDKAGFLFDCELSNECLSLGQGLFPSPRSSDVCYDIQSVSEAQKQLSGSGATYEMDRWAPSVHTVPI